MAKQLLNRSNISTILKQMRRKAVSKRVRSCIFGKASLAEPPVLNAPEMYRCAGDADAFFQSLDPARTWQKQTETAT